MYDGLLFIHLATVLWPSLLYSFDASRAAPISRCVFPYFTLAGF
jgi:hypothetical protein